MKKIISIFANIVRKLTIIWTQRDAQTIINVFFGLLFYYIIDFLKFQSTYDSTKYNQNCIVKRLHVDFKEISFSPMLIKRIVQRI